MRFNSPEWAKTKGEFMARIIFDEDEKELKWNELSNETIGKLVRVAMIDTEKYSKLQPEENIKSNIFSMASMILMLRCVKSVNAETVTHTIDDLMESEKHFGNWEIQIKKIT